MANTFKLLTLTLALISPSVYANHVFVSLGGSVGGPSMSNRNYGSMGGNGEIGYVFDNGYLASINGFYLHHMGSFLLGDRDDSRGIGGSSFQLGKQFAYGQNIFNLNAGVSSFAENYWHTSNDQQKGLAIELGYKYVFGFGLGLGLKYNAVGTSDEQYSLVSFNLSFDFY